MTNKNNVINIFYNELKTSGLKIADYCPDKIKKTKIQIIYKKITWSKSLEKDEEKIVEDIKNWTIKIQNKR